MWADFPWVASKNNRHCCWICWKKTFCCQTVSQDAAGNEEFRVLHNTPGRQSYQVIWCCINVSCSGPGRITTQTTLKTAWRLRTKKCSTLIWTTWTGLTSFFTTSWEHDSTSWSRILVQFRLAKENWKYCGSAIGLSNLFSYISYTKFWHIYFGKTDKTFGHMRPQNFIHIFFLM